MAHRRSARQKGLDRAPGPSLALAPAARALLPMGDFARRDPDCCLVGERKGTFGLVCHSLVPQGPPRLRISTARRNPCALSPRPAPPSSVSSGDFTRAAKARGARRSVAFVIYNEDQTPRAGTGLFPVLYCFFSETPPTARPLLDAPPVAGLRRESERYGSRPSKLELQKLWPIQQDRSRREWDCPVRLL